MAKKFILSKHKKYTLNSILYDLNYLVYCSSKEPLGYKEKSFILKHIFEIIAGREELQLKDGEQMTPEFSDVAIFFERRNYMLKHLQAGVKKQAQLN